MPSDWSRLFTAWSQYYSTSTSTSDGTYWVQVELPWEVFDDDYEIQKQKVHKGFFIE